MSVLTTSLATLSLLLMPGMGKFSVDTATSVSTPNSCACDIYIPNAFSPNDDGRNDVFQPQTNCAILDYELHVFDRWGTEVFSSLSYDIGWNGEVQGQPAAEAVYIYILKYTVGTGELMEEEIKTGDVALLR